MQRYLYFCPKCHLLGSAGHENPNDYQQCSECKSSMIFTGITKEEWDNKTDEEKGQLKSRFSSELVEESSIAKSGMDNDAFLNQLEKMSNDISIIKTIMVFWLLLSILSSLITIVRLS